MISLKSKREIELMRDAGRIVAEVLAETRFHCRAGVTTQELDRIAETKTIKAGAKPLFKGYKGFPGALCTSINYQVVHGIPGNYVLKTGDIVSMDFGALYKGYCGDGAITVPIGVISLQAANLLKVTEECLYLGIEQMVVGKHVSDVSRAIQIHGESHGYSMVRDLGGHGIGRNMHEDPMVLNYVTPGRGAKLRPGLVLAVEPMVNAGTEETVTLSDGWTVATRDRKLSAHFEHTVAVTENGPDILTKLA